MGDDRVTLDVTGSDDVVRMVLVVVVVAFLVVTDVDNFIVRTVVVSVSTIVVCSWVDVVSFELGASFIQTSGKETEAFSTYIKVVFGVSKSCETNR